MSILNNLSGAGLFSQAIQGLVSNFNYIGQGGNLTLENLKDTSNNESKNLINSQFRSYLVSNFGKLDKNGDGEIGADELQNYTNTMLNKGMTLDEITQLCSQYGSSNSLLETVMANFSQIDKNHDGRVTDAEIKAFGLEEEIDKMKDEYSRFNPKAMSIFYSTGESEEA